ncbi:MAG: hypothetical protein ACK2T4_00370 [Candidatus Promineifilaceae bacterium]
MAVGIQVCVVSVATGADCEAGIELLLSISGLAATWGVEVPDGGFSSVEVGESVTEEVAGNGSAWFSFNLSSIWLLQAVVNKTRAVIKTGNKFRMPIGVSPLAKFRFIARK